jgi:hypothetical protein
MPKRQGTTQETRCGIHKEAKSIEFSLLGLAYSFLSKIPKFLFGNHKHLTNVLDIWFAVEILTSIGRTGFFIVMNIKIINIKKTK